jgi:hypothetical protein
MLAHNRLERYLRIVRAFGEVTVNPDPVHDAPVTHLFLSDYLNVIFGLTGNGTVSTPVHEFKSTAIPNDAH